MNPASLNRVRRSGTGSSPASLASGAAGGSAMRRASASSARSRTDAALVAVSSVPRSASIEFWSLEHPPVLEPDHRGRVGPGRANQRRRCVDHLTSDSPLREDDDGNIVEAAVDGHRGRVRDVGVDAIEVVAQLARSRVRKSSDSVRTLSISRSSRSTIASSTTVDPMRMPSPSARKTAMSEMRWNRKLTMEFAPEKPRRVARANP